MGIDLGKATNQGTALLKFAHQFQPDIILEDPYVGWFFDATVAQALQQDALHLGTAPTDDTQRFLQIAYWYIILREKHGDQVITDAIAAGCQQLLLLGSGYDTRFLRLPAIRERAIATFEVDLPQTIATKESGLRQQLGSIPPGLTLVPLDFNHDDLNGLQHYGFDPTLATAYIWQGVSYYLPQESVAQVLDWIKLQMAPDSVLVFDACSPLLVAPNDQVPGVAASIDRLTEIGEPYLFGLFGHEMKTWLADKGFHDIQILQQDDLETTILHQRTLPNNMWYVTVARTTPPS